PEPHVADVCHDDVHSRNVEVEQATDHVAEPAPQAGAPRDRLADRLETRLAILVAERQENAGLAADRLDHRGLRDARIAREIVEPQRFETVGDDSRARRVQYQLPGRPASHHVPRIGTHRSSFASDGNGHRFPPLRRTVARVPVYGPKLVYYSNDLTYTGAGD